MNYTFRPCTFDDFDFLFELKKQNFKYYVDKIWGWDDNEQRQKLMRDLKEHLEHKKIIMINNCVAGIYASHITEDGDLFINEISILPKYQNMGIGSNILNDVLRENHERGTKTILQVFKENRARKLYESLGFRIYNETETHFQMENI